MLIKILKQSECVESVAITTCYENEISFTNMFVWICREICKNLSRHVIKLLPQSFISLRQNKD